MRQTVQPASAQVRCSSKASECCGACQASCGQERLATWSSRGRLAHQGAASSPTRKKRAFHARSVQMALLDAFLSDHTGLSEQILGLLPLRSLAALDCCNRAMRSVTATLPEHLWQVSVAAACLKPHMLSDVSPALPACRPLPGACMPPRTQS